MEVKRAIERLLATIPDPRVFSVLLTSMPRAPLEIRRDDMANQLFLVIDTMKLWVAGLGDAREVILDRALRDVSNNKRKEVIKSWLVDFSNCLFYCEPPLIAPGWFSKIAGSADSSTIAILEDIIPQDTREPSR
jgi:hypothetical protein